MFVDKQVYHACYCWQNKTILSQNLWWPSGGKCFCSFYRHNCHDESCKPVILIPYISLYYVPVNSNCTSPIIHRACLSTLCITVNFNFSWVLQCMVLREIKRECFFWGGTNKLYYGRCANGGFTPSVQTPGHFQGKERKKRHAYWRSSSICK